MTGSSGPALYEQLCFVAMPFGVKDVGGQPVDFDRLYDAVFEPALSGVSLPEGGRLVPHRADRDFYAGVIDEDMYRYLEYSRFVLADISGQNPNVFYELGVRHRSRESGTAIFQQIGDPIPFDVSHVRVFPYTQGSDAADAEARSLIERVVTESLRRNRLDSPVAAALRAQREGQGADRLLDRALMEAENAIRAEDRPRAVQAYRRAIRLDPENFTLHLEAGILLRDTGDWPGAVEAQREAVRIEPEAAAAWRELGVALNKLHARSDDEPRTGEAELRRAVELDPHDSDAWASLGGVLKRKPDYEGALDSYERAVAESGGASYPLLNAMKVRAAISGKLDLSDADRIRLRRVQRRRARQAEQDPPYDAPWSFFDLAEVLLYLDDPNGFLRYLDEGVLHSAHGWQPGTFADSLQIVSLDGPKGEALAQGVLRLRSAAAALSV
ncbi:tetratricopeptide repeat protein [Rubrivirga litoralis]|uniref:Tetratricopeptide repeat protein n=1 Tax=Rubrivirga litoralis TaxID=3075598 RepID=A0ABU3BRU6_9BACT|nr:tetratricopeptide repeat protein [Rubrivirga sp. F394]MDT0631970.1 tetratricopeptide repeat protein [Rubrivirga sp. F394]